MLFIRNLVFATAVALFSGFASAHYAVDLFGKSANLRTGQWTRLESIENTAGNPYRAALKVRTSGVALAPGEGLVFTSQQDAAGDPFQAGCEYHMRGRMPHASLWSVAATAARGQQATEFMDRRYIVSRSAVWESDGAVAITIAPKASPGNWIAAPPSSGYIVSLRLYDTPLALNTALLDAQDLPRIEKGACT